VTASPHQTGATDHKATEEEGDQGILGKEIWRKYGLDLGVTEVSN